MQTKNDHTAIADGESDRTEAGPERRAEDSGAAAALQRQVLERVLQCRFRELWRVGAEGWYVAHPDLTVAKTGRLKRVDK